MLKKYPVYLDPKTHKKKLRAGVKLKVNNLLEENQSESGIIRHLINQGIDEKGNLKI